MGLFGNDGAAQVVLARLSEIFNSGRLHNQERTLGLALGLPTLPL